MSKETIPASTFVENEKAEHETETVIKTIPVLTIRLIKSFEYRTFKNLLLRNIPQTMTVSELKQRINQGNLYC